MNGKKISYLGGFKLNIRCPICYSAKLHGVSIAVRKGTRVLEKIPIKLCQRCKVLIIDKSFVNDDWKIWGSSKFINPDTKD